MLMLMLMFRVMFLGRNKNIKRQEGDFQTGASDALRASILQHSQQYISSTWIADSIFLYYDYVLRITI